MNREPQVERYLSELPKPLAAIARAARAVVRRRAPELHERICMGIPTWEGNGRVCYLAEYRDHVNLGFYQGRSLPDPSRILEGTGKALRHVKLAHPSRARDPAVGTLIDAAVRFDATRSKASD